MPAGIPIKALTDEELKWLKKQGNGIAGILSTARFWSQGRT
jgi:hypothetical protein